METLVEKHELLLGTISKSEIIQPFKRIV